MELRPRATALGRSDRHYSAYLIAGVPLVSAGSDRSDDARIENTSATCTWSLETQAVDWGLRITSRVEWQVVDCIIMYPRKTGP